MSFLEKAGDFLDKATETAGRTGSYVKLKAQIASNQHKREELMLKIADRVMQNPDMVQYLRQTNETLFMELDHIDNEAELLREEHDRLKEEGLIPDDEEDDD